MNIERIEKFLSGNAKINDYKITEVNTRSYELFFVHSALETVRSTDTKTISVVVYVDHDGKRGSSGFSLYSSNTDSELEEKINSAAEKALYINNEYYDLPENECLDDEIESNFSDCDMPDAAAKIAEAVFAADTNENGSINALEVFVNRYETTVKNSRGINKRCVKYSAMAEAIPTWNEGESVELYECKRMSTLDENDITSEIAEKMTEVSLRGRATPPTEKLSCDVMIDAPEIEELLWSIVSQLDYSAVYTRSNYYSLGDKIQKSSDCDKLNVTMRGAIKGSASSALFDDDGVTLEDVNVIKDGEAVNYYGSNRFARYLKQKPTGALKCIELGEGSVDDADLKKAPYFRCVSMSGLQIDLFNDYIGGEVRLAYYCDGEKVTPISSVSIAGSLSTALNSLRLSKNVTVVGGYKGPRFALLKGIEIV